MEKKRCNKFALPTKPLSGPHETVLKHSQAYIPLGEAGDEANAVSYGADLGLLAQQFVGLSAAKGVSMTVCIALLVCCSAALFLAHAFEAYQAG